MRRKVSKVSSPIRAGDLVVRGKRGDVVMKSRARDTSGHIGIALHGARKGEMVEILVDGGDLDA